MKSVPEDPKAADLASEIDKVNRGLERCEKEILGRLRMPLDNRSPTQDLERRLSEHEVSESGGDVWNHESWNSCTPGAEKLQGEFDFLNTLQIY